MTKLPNPFLRLFFTLLPLAGILSLLGYRDALRQSALIYLPNSTYFLLASDDPYTRTKMTNDINQLLYQPSPALRQSLLQWWRNRQSPPVIMSALPGFARRNPSCAVVGNSGILIGSRHGHSIDSHGIVIRLNNAPVRGHERDVGSKTNLSFINSNILHKCYGQGGGCNCHPYGPSVPIIMYICQAAHFLDYFACNSSASLQITDIRFDKLCARIAKYYSIKRFVQATGKPLQEWAKFRHPMHFHYSSGMQAVMLAMGICDRVAVFGFGKSSNAKHHYHTNRSRELRVHDYEAEYEFYRDLVQKPKSIPFLWDSGFSLPHLVFYH